MYKVAGYTFRRININISFFLPSFLCLLLQWESSLQGKNLLFYRVSKKTWTFFEIDIISLIFKESFPNFVWS